MTTCRLSGPRLSIHTQQGWQGPTQHTNKPIGFAFRIPPQRQFAHAFLHTGKRIPLPHTQFKGKKEKGLKAVLSFMLIRDYLEILNTTTARPTFSYLVWESDPFFSTVPFAWHSADAKAAVRTRTVPRPAWRQRVPWPDACTWSDTLMECFCRIWYEHIFRVQLF